jgi:hypothetical protein
MSVGGGKEPAVVNERGEARGALAYCWMPILQCASISQPRAIFYRIDGKETYHVPGFEGSGAPGSACSVRSLTLRAPSSREK